jgi:O-acetyl-ADP-ribose deacetylase
MLTITHGNILDIPADILICSANPWLNLSGGVGGALLLRHGSSLQSRLHALLASQNKKLLPPTTVILDSPPNTPYKAIAHAIAIDAAYRTDIPTVAKTISIALDLLAPFHPAHIALTALGTGYGPLKPAQFGQALAIALQNRPHPPITVCLRHDHEADEVRTALTGSAGVQFSGAAPISKPPSKA